MGDTFSGVATIVGGACGVAAAIIPLLGRRLEELPMGELLVTEDYHSWDQAETDLDSTTRRLYGYDGYGEWALGGSGTARVDNKMANRIASHVVDHQVAAKSKLFSPLSPGRTPSITEDGINQAILANKNALDKAGMAMKAGMTDQQKAMATDLYKRVYEGNQDPTANDLKLLTDLSKKFVPAATTDAVAKDIATFSKPSLGMGYMNGPSLGMGYMNGFGEAPPRYNCHPWEHWTIAEWNSFYYSAYPFDGCPEKKYY